MVQSISSVGSGGGHKHTEGSSGGRCGSGQLLSMVLGVQLWWLRSLGFQQGSGSTLRELKEPDWGMQP